MVKKSYSAPEFVGEDASKYDSKIDDALSSFDIGDCYLLSCLQRVGVITENRYYVILCRYALPMSRGSLISIKSD